MKKSSYRERDYIFGQLMLTRRMATGLTQAGLADLLGVSRHAVSGWEAGQSYPKANHLKVFIRLCLQQHVFTAGHEVEEIRALWRAAHQKILLDELWLQEVLKPQAAPPVEVVGKPAHTTTPSFMDEPRMDWGDALDVPTFYGRKEELALLSRWVVEERCRVVSVLGMGGIGKSALTVTLMYQISSQFEVVIWRSLRDAPTCAVLLDECLQVLYPNSAREKNDSLESLLNTFMEQLRLKRVLLVLDNLEMLLQEGDGIGGMRAGFEGYAQLLRRMGETRHQSCLLFTSREKPADLVALEGRRSPVRTLRLAGLDAHAGVQVLAEKDVVSPLHDQMRLVEVYRGNPLALKIVAQTIVELFGGEIVPFLEQGTVVFGGVRELLDEQFDRLSALEQTVFFWLAILREPVSLDELLAVLAVPRAPMDILEALDRLRRRSIIEQGQRVGSFTLQSVVLEYATARLIAEVAREIEQGQLVLLIAHGLCLAQAKEYIRKSQEYLLVVPLLARLQSTSQEQVAVETRLLSLLDHLRSPDQKFQGYGPANLVALLRLLRNDLRGINLSRLGLRRVFLQGVHMQDADLSGATFQNCVFTEPIDAIDAIAISRNGQYWAAASLRGDVWVWAESGQVLYRAWRAHVSVAITLAFSPDGSMLASGGWDGAVKLWDIASGTLLWAGWQPGGVNLVAFAPDGRLLASCGRDTPLIQLWNPLSGKNVQTLRIDDDRTSSLAWSPDGRLLANGSSNGSIWLWERQGGELHAYKQILTRHTGWLAGLAFSPDGTQLASASFDGTVKLWDMQSLDCRQTFVGHTDYVIEAVWSSDGRTLASCSFDHTIRVWDVKQGKLRAILRGHRSLIYCIVFAPDGRTLLSGSDDSTLRVWDVYSGQCLRIIGGYTASLCDIDWSPDGTQLASCGTDALVTIWDEANKASPVILDAEHRWTVEGVTWSPDGRLLASAGYDGRIVVWDTLTRARLHVLQNIDTIFMDVAWSPDGHSLACGSYLSGMLVWDVRTRTRSWVEQAPQMFFKRVAWSPDSIQLAGGGGDGCVYVWDGRDGTLQQRLTGHKGVVTCVMWSPDGRWLASVGGGKEGGELFVWEAHNGKRVKTFAGHPDLTTAVAWSLSGELLISGDSEGVLRWWEVFSGECIRVQEGHRRIVQSIKVSPAGKKLASCGNDGAIVLWDVQSGERLQTLRRDRPYERLNIAGIQGVTEAQKAALRVLGALEDTITR